MPNANLMVRIGGDSSDFKKAAREASMSLEDIGKKAASVASGIATAMAAAGGAMVAMSVSASQSAAELQTLANISGTTTTEFQRLAAGARTVQIENEKLSDIYKDVNDRVGDFLTTGAGPMADFFEQVGPKVGITAEHFRNLSGPQALQLFVNSMEEAGLNSQQMTFHMEAMASDSAKLLPLLANNGEKMRELGDAAAKIPGKIMPAEDVEKLAEANQRWIEIKDNMQGITNTIAPEITRFLLGVTDLLRDGANWAAKWLEDMRANNVADKIEKQNELREKLNEIENKLNQTYEQRKQLLIEQNIRAQSLSEYPEKQNALALQLYEQEQKTLEIEKQRTQELINQLGLKAKAIQTIEVQQTAEPIANLPQPEFSEPTVVPPSVQAEWDKSQAIMEATLERYSLEKEAAIVHEEEMKALKDAYTVGRIESEAELREMEIAAEAEHQRRLMQEVEKGAKSRQAFDQLTLNNKLKMVSSHLSQLTAGVANSNKTLFNINKVAAISEAVINGISGVSKTLATYPFPINVGMAAAHGLVALAQVNQIRSAQYGGGGGGGASIPTGGGAAPNAGALPQAGGSGGAGNRGTLFVEGLSKDSIFSGDAVASLAGKLLDFQKNGGQVVLSS